MVKDDGQWRRRMEEKIAMERNRNTTKKKIRGGYYIYIYKAAKKIESTKIPK